MKTICVYLFVFSVIVILFAFFYYISNSISSEKDIIDSIYFSSVTYFTVGFGDISPKNDLGKIFVIIEGAIGIIINSIFTGLIFYIFLKTKNKILLPTITCFKYKNNKCSLTFRIGNKGCELINPRCIVEIFRFEEDRRIRVEALTKEWPYIEKVVYFNFLYKVMNGESEYQIRITIIAYDSYTNELVYSSKIMEQYGVKFISEYKMIYKWKNQNRGEINWKMFDEVNELNETEKEKLKKSAKQL